MDKKIAIVTYETPFAPGGGISAVMAHLPRALQEVSQNPVIVVTPYHINLGKTTSAESKMETIGTVKVSFNTERYSTQILRLNQDIDWIFIRPAGKPKGEPYFFAGQRHPYDVNIEDDGNTNYLLRDSLFFCQAAISVLNTIDERTFWTILMQDWETAPVSLVIHSLGIEDQHTCFLTLHNTYDMQLTDEDLLKLKIDPGAYPGETVLQRSLPLIQDPIFTVSQQFALDISSEVMLSSVMAPQITTKIAPRLMGINNGTFTYLAVPKEIISATGDENYIPLQEWKSNKRENAYQALDEIGISEDTPIWGDLKKFVRDDAPWFVMAGRDDSRQKGYDLACNAIAQYISDGGRGRFLLFPIPGEEGLPGIRFLKKLANRNQESVLVLPFIFREGYFSVLQGATFGLMPSYYEPFGMANEYYLNGAACIGRATGGISQQVIPYRNARSFTKSVQVRSDRWHEPETHATGFLFRERDEISLLTDDWQAINSAKYNAFGGSPDRLEQRMDLLLFQDMTNAFRTSLEDATELYMSGINQYYKMVFNGIEYITKNFTWSDTAKTYNQIISG